MYATSSLPVKRQPLLFTLQFFLRRSCSSIPDPAPVSISSSRDRLQFIPSLLASVGLLVVPSIDQRQQHYSRPVTSEVSSSYVVHPVASAGPLSVYIELNSSYIDWIWVKFELISTSQCIQSLLASVGLLQWFMCCIISASNKPMFI